MIFMVFISIKLCYTSSKIGDSDEKEKYDKKFKVIVGELKNDQLPFFYFIFFIRRFILMIFINFINYPTMRLILSSTLQLSVIFI